MPLLVEGRIEVLRVRGPELSLILVLDNLGYLLFNLLQLESAILLQHEGLSRNGTLHALAGSEHSGDTEDLVFGVGVGLEFPEGGEVQFPGGMVHVRI